MRVVGRVYNEEDSIIGDDVIVTDIDISGTNISYELNLAVPAVPGYYKIRYTVYAIDSKGAEAGAVLWLTVLPTPVDPAPFVVLRYTGEQIFNRLLNAAYGFNFTSREVLP
ncbi:MAG: hypothetical protein AAF549_09260, partial [Pseudomonadota bacterium]